MLMFVIPVACLLIAGMAMTGDISGETSAAYGMMIPVDIISHISAWVLAIISGTK